MIKLSGSVGKGGSNQTADVKKVCALINVYRRQNKDAPLSIATRTSTELETAIGEFQKNYLKSSKPDSRVDAGGRSLKKLNEILKSVFKAKTVTAPTFGKVTWDSEGAEGGPFHSRKLHVPSLSSGLTIGRGYDFRRKKQAGIKSDLISAGVSLAQATVLQKAAGLSGNKAKQFIIDNDLLDFQVTPDAQKKLFKISYDYEAAQVKRICSKSDVEKIYGKTDWDKLDSKIKDIAVDLKFRGDYTSSSRKIIQKSIADNDLTEFKKLMKDKSNWTRVPKDRFNRRVKFLS